MELHQSTLLVLHGISLNDCETPEEQFNRILLEKIDIKPIQLNKSKTDYRKIPKSFTTIENWPTNTNLKCWECDRNFNTVPCFIPKSYSINREGRHTYGVYGNFCTFPCARSYCENNFREGILWQKVKLLLKVYEAFYGIQVSDVPLAPKKTMLEEYGGEATKEEFDIIFLNLQKKQQQMLDESSMDNLTIMSHLDMLE
jgi:hypothetical protein